MGQPFCRKSQGKRILPSPLPRYFLLSDRQRESSLLRGFFALRNTPAGAGRTTQIGHEQEIHSDSDDKKRPPEQPEEFSRAQRSENGENQALFPGLPCPGWNRTAGRNLRGRVERRRNDSL